MDRTDKNVVTEQEKKNNVITTIYSISRLVETILKRDNEKLKSIGGEHPEVQILREKCKDKDAVISTTACQAMVTLVESGVHTIPNTLSTFVAMLPYFNTYVGVTAALGQLLVLDMKMRLSPQTTYKCIFNLQSPQHPLITVLKQKNDTWHDVINQIIFLCNHTKEDIRSNSTELVKPVVLYVLCDPSSTIAARPYRQHLWSLLMSLPSTQLLEICIPWLQVEDLKSAPALYHQLCSNLKLLQNRENRLFSKPYLALALASLADTLVTQGQDPRTTLKVLDEMLSDGCVFIGSCVIMILSNTLTKSPIIYTSALMLTCSQILSKQACVPLAGQILAAALLPWLAYPSILTSDILVEAETLLKQTEGLDGISITEALFTTHAFPAAHLSVRIYSLMASWSAISGSTVTWLKQLSHMPKYLRSDCNLLLGALLIHESNTSAELSTSLSVLLELVNSLPELGTSILTWLLYRLARERNPNNQLELLKALPLMGGQKENVTLVIHTLESLQGSIKMRPLLLNLYLCLWRHEPRSFPYLHKLLLIDNKDVDLHWEIAKVVAMKEICELRPSQHGTDMVPILSNVLNRLTMNHNAGLPSSLALEAITALCEAKVVDVATTWTTLAPRLSKDTRIPVVISLCKLLGLISEVRSSNKSQNKLFLEAQTKLWSYVTTSKHSEIIQAALKALSQFSVDQLRLKVMPERFRQGLVLPPEYAKTPIDAARKPEDVLPYIPGDCWIQLLSDIPEGTTLVKALFNTEVSEMRGALSHPTGRAEPALPRLIANSICLTLISHIRKNLADPDTAVVPCLQILAQPNLLPPCDWSFLSTLAKNNECQRLCFSIASIQAKASPSARGVAENFLKDLYTKIPEDSEVLFAFTILGDLCKGVAPNILRPLIENSLQISLAAAQNKDGVQDSARFCEFIKHIKIALMNEDIHEANRALLSILLEALLDSISLDNDEVFSCYAESVGELSVKFLERMSSPSVWWEITSVKLRKAIHIRSRLAINTDTDTPLVWLNECIDATATQPREQDLLLHRLVSVLEASQGKVSSREWLLQLMGHVQAALTSSDKRTEAAFLCDIFTLAVIVLSGHSCLVMDSQILAESREMRHLLLAQSLRSLLLMPSYNTITSQVIEWLHHVVKSSVTGEELTKELYVCLQALRHTPAMLQRGVWNRIVTL